MSQTEKAELYNELKAAGVQFSKHYREYSTAELQEAVLELRSHQAADSPPPEPEPEPEFDPAATAAAYAALAEEEQPAVASAPPPAPEIPRPASEAPTTRTLPPPPNARPQSAPPAAPVARRNEDEMAGQRLNDSADLEPIRTDPDTGFVWYQEEVRKPAYPKPRGRRVLQYMDSGTKTETVKNGEYVESFEVAGEGVGRPAQVKITLPSYQVGIYKDRRFPFKIHVYNEQRGFDLFEVQNYYGGAELVPADIKRVYVENVLCYDIRTTVQSIQREYRQLQLQGKVK